MKKNNIIDEIEERNKNQFNPGFYTGGNLHPFYMSKPYKSKYVAIFWFIQSILILICIIGFLFSVIIEKAKIDLLGFIFIIAVLSMFFIITFKCGKKYVNMYKKKKK